MEKELIKKIFYKTLLGPGEKRHPVQVLGEAFFEEHKKTVGDLSAIRFAQGEVYYHHKDYEAAITKWDIVNGELEPWAKKNIGDAYLELEWFLEAEKKYKSVITKDNLLAVEVALKLFYIYREREMVDQAYETVQKAISIDREYPNVMDMAIEFYWEQKDWDNLIELVVDETLRVKNEKWFEILKDCIDKGYQRKFSPAYFSKLLQTWYDIDENQFVVLVDSLWRSYKGTEYSLDMIYTFNELLKTLVPDLPENRKELSKLYEDCYQELLSGKYTVKELQPIVPHLLGNWLRIQEKFLFPAAAVLAWEEIFPSSIDHNLFKEAEKNVFHFEHKGVQLHETKDLLETLFTWAEVNNLTVSKQTKWYASKILDLKKKHLFITGFNSKASAAIVNGLLQENVFKEVPVTASIDSSDRKELRRISDSGDELISNVSAGEKNSLVAIEWQSMYLQQFDYSLLYTSELYNEDADRNYLTAADGILFVLDSNRPIKEEEKKLLVKLQEQALQVPIHFVMYNHENMVNYEEVNRLAENTERELREFFSNTRVYSFSAFNGHKLQGLIDFMKTNYSWRTNLLEKKRAAKLLQFIRNTLTDLLNKRILEGNTLNEKIKTNEEILEKLRQLHSELEETQMWKAKDIIHAYSSKKEEAKKGIKESIPPLLRSCSEEITEESNFKTLLEQLNSSMNEKIASYFREEVIPGLRKSFHEWMSIVKQDLLSVQEGLQEGERSIKELENLELKCDFEILSDWQRDLNRMVSRIELEEENIINRTKPSQLLLKSAGVLLGSIQQNKAMLSNQYKKYVENGNYEEVSSNIIAKYLHDFDLFEKNLKADLAIFFEPPANELLHQIHTIEKEIEKTKAELVIMNENPDLFYDPLKLFEVRLLQCEIIKNTSEEVPLATVFLQNR